MKVAQSVSQSVSQSKFFAKGDAVNYQAVLEDQARKHRAIGDLIRALAVVAGVDPAPYLDAPATVDDAPALPRVVKPGKAPKPPRPQSPASSSTNGAGQVSKVELNQAAKREEILKALRKTLRPVTPGELASELEWALPKLRQYIQPLVDAGTVKAEGTTSSRRFSLAKT